MATRRDMLAGITAVVIAAPAKGVAIAPQQPNRSAWNAAMAVYDKAKADADRAHERWNCAGETYKELTGFTPWEKHERNIAAERLSGFAQINHNIDDWGDRLGDAAETLIEMPAPDHEALLWKVEYLWGDDLGAGYSDEWMEVVMADFRRLLSAGRA